MKPIDPVAQRKGRRHLLLIVLVFIAPMVIAGVLTVVGWQPGTKGNGAPILPQRNFQEENLQVRLEDGQTWPWRDEKPRLTLIALAGPDCATECLATLTAVAKARVMLNQNQSRLRLLYLGTPPVEADRDGMRNYWQLGTDVDDRLAVYRPTAPDSVSALLVESNGTALSLYSAGFDEAGLMRDMRKVIR